jgi:hypothetical protein
VAQSCAFDEPKERKDLRSDSSTSMRISMLYQPDSGFKGMTIWKRPTETKDSDKVIKGTLKMVFWYSHSCSKLRCTDELMLM